jgi:hypothetical protein
MPIREKTITPSIPDPQQEPGAYSQEDNDQMNLSGFPPDPSYHVEPDDDNMQDGEEDIEEGVQ